MGTKFSKTEEIIFNSESLYTLKIRSKLEYKLYRAFYEIELSEKYDIDSISYFYAKVKSILKDTLPVGDE